MGLLKTYTNKRRMILAHFFVKTAVFSFTVYSIRLIRKLCFSANCIQTHASLEKRNFYRKSVPAQAGFTQLPSVAGFTLIELLIVISIITILGGMTLFFDVNAYRGDAFRAERTILTIALQTARADALNNMHQKKHGVKINPTGYAGYVIFEGDSFAVSDVSTRTYIPSSYQVIVGAGSVNEIVFSQLSGDALCGGSSTCDTNIVLVDPERNASTTIAINHEGKIGI